LNQNDAGLMEVQFWGVRGSHPAPLTPDYIRQKIASVVQRIRPADVVSQDSRERFLATLPEDIFSTPGGNTTCIEVRPNDQNLFIIDAGTGIIELGRKLRAGTIPNQEIHVFFTHFHYDHIQGLPFFVPAYNPGVTVHFYSPEPDIEFTLKDHMKHPYFPVTMQDFMTKKLVFHTIPTDTPIKFPGDVTVIAHQVRHPGRAYGYKVQNLDRSAIFVPDYEILQEDFLPSPEAESFFFGADLLVLDTMYTLGEAIEKINWGHSSFSIGIEFAHKMQVKNLYLFHHEPVNDDRRMYTNLRSAEWFAQRMVGKKIHVFLAEEGKIVRL